MSLSCHVMPRHVRHVTSCHVMSRHVTSCHVTSCHVMSRLATSCHVMPRHVMSRHVMSRVTSWHVMSRRKSRDGHTTNASLSTDFFHTQLIQIRHNRVRWLSRRVPIPYRINGRVRKDNWRERKERERGRREICQWLRLNRIIILIILSKFTNKSWLLTNSYVQVICQFCWRQTQANKLIYETKVELKIIDRS